jgi:hypothetical protein
MLASAAGTMMARSPAKYSSIVAVNNHNCNTTMMITMLRTASAISAVSNTDQRE